VATRTPSAEERRAKDEMRATSSPSTGAVAHEQPLLCAEQPSTKGNDGVTEGRVPHVQLEQDEDITNDVSGAVASASVASAVVHSRTPASGSNRTDAGALVSPRVTSDDRSDVPPPTLPKGSSSKGKGKAPAGPTGGRFKPHARPARSLPKIAGLGNGVGFLLDGAAGTSAGSSVRTDVMLTRTMTVAMQPLFKEVQQLTDAVMELKEDVAKLSGQLDTHGKATEAVRASTVKIEENLNQGALVGGADIATDADTRKESGACAKSDFSSYKEVVRVRARVRASLSHTFATTSDSSDIVPDADAYRDLIQLDTQTELNIDEDTAHDWLMANVAVPPRRDGAPATLTRALVVLLRAKSHWVQALKKRILLVYFRTIEVDARVLHAADAVQWVADLKYFTSVVGRKGVLAAAGAVLSMTGGGARIIKPMGVGDGTVLEATTRHFGFVCAIVRAALDEAAGVDTDSTIGEAFYKRLEVEQERVDAELPMDNLVHDGLRLTDGNQ